MAKEAATKAKDAATKERAKDRKAKDLPAKIAGDLEQLAADVKAGRLSPRKALKKLKGDRARWKKALRKK